MPLSGSNKPPKTLRRVVLPVPLAPIIPNLIPGERIRSNFEKKRRPPRDLEMFLATINFWVNRSVAAKSICERWCLFRVCTSDNSSIHFPACLIRDSALVVRALGDCFSHSCS